MTTNPWNLPDEDGPAARGDATAGHQAWPASNDTGRYAEGPGYAADPYGQDRFEPGRPDPARPGAMPVGTDQYRAGGYDDAGYDRQPYGQARSAQGPGSADDYGAGRYDDPRSGSDRYGDDGFDGSRRGDGGQGGYDGQGDEGRRTAQGAAPAPQGGAPKKSGRAGRNLPAAIGVGVGLGAVLLASLLLLKVAFVVVVAAAVLLGLRELSGAMRAGGIVMPLIPVAAGAVGMIVAAYTGGAQALVIALALTAFVTLVWRMAEGAENFLRDGTAGVFAAVYVPFLAAFAVLMLAPHDGARRVMLFLILTVCSDTGGYAAGVIGGKHPMAPRISPKKSWEGLVGSIVVAGAGGAIGIHFLLSGNVVEGVVTGLAAVASATLGDLIESVMKRDLGIKDMGTLLPGHGGIMDRLDSLLATAPVVWLLLTVFVPPR